MRLRQRETEGAANSMSAQVLTMTKRRDLRKRKQRHDTFRERQNAARRLAVRAHNLDYLVRQAPWRVRVALWLMVHAASVAAWFRRRAR